MVPSARHADRTLAASPSLRIGTRVPPLKNCICLERIDNHRAEGEKVGANHAL